VFLVWELTDDEPIVDLRLFRHRNFAAGTLALVLAYAAFFSIGLLVPLWLQNTLDYTSIWAGLATFLRAVGGSFSASITTYIWTRGGGVNHANLGEHNNLY
jgi:hypothetical protein